MPALAICVDTAVAVPPSVVGGAATPGCAPRTWDFAGTLPAPEAPFVAYGGTPPSTAAAAAAALAAAISAATASAANSNSNNIINNIGTPTTGAVPWSVDHSAELYRVDGWGAPYFSVNAAGNISVRPHGSETLSHQEIDLMKVVKKASDPKSAGGLGLQLPLIVRFPDVLRHRLNSLQSAFDYAIRSSGYGNRYQGVYPVKCNQDRYIVEDIVEFGSQFRFGLEAGSKPELLLAMSSLVARGGPGSSEAFLVCNGYKDEEYVSLALLGRKLLDLNTVIVLEQEEELDTVIEASRKLGVRPVIGLRAKLRTKHSGHFGSTSGEKGKFGLTTLQVLSVARRLQRLDMLDCLQLLHFHIGSQIPSTSLLSDGVGEAAQIYCELVKLGAAMKVIDIGGGLGIDYDGTRSGGSDMSVGYTLDEYASAVVNAIRYACDRKYVPHPIICSESGRALVSHHSVLVFEVVSSSSSPSSRAVDPAAAAASVVDLAYLAEGLGEDAYSEYRNLMASAVRGDCETCLICIDQLKRRCVEQFKDGSLGLEHLAAVDGLCELVSNTMAAASASDDVRTYHVNLSLFTSIPDFWAIGQLFPVLPIHRLDQRPGVRGVLSDLTCDSDGKMDLFIGGNGSLPLHEMNTKSGGGGGYYLGMFLGGAYQEALGGLHNLFGGPSVVRVSQSDGPHCFAVTRAVPGPSCADVLRSMQHEPEVMFENLKQRADECGVGGGDGVARGLARAFNSMPYLVCSSSESESGSGMEEDVDDVDDGDREDDVCHYCVSGEEDDSGGDGAAFDDLEWDLYRCMLE